MMKQYTFPCAILVAAVLLTSCGNPRQQETQQLEVERTLLPRMNYTIIADTQTRSKMEISRDGSWEDLPPQEFEQSLESVQELRCGSIEDQRIPLELETTRYHMNLGDDEQDLRLAGGVGVGFFDLASRRIAMTDMQGTWADTVLSQAELGQFLFSSYQAIQSVVMDSIEVFSLGVADTLMSPQVQTIGPLEIELKEYTATSLKSIAADSAVFQVTRWAELVETEKANHANTTLEGRGEGILVYDRNRHYTIHSTMQTSLNVVHEADKLHFRAESNSHIDVRTLISEQ